MRLFIDCWYCLILASPLTHGWTLQLPSICVRSNYPLQTISQHRRLNRIRSFASVPDQDDFLDVEFEKKSTDLGAKEDSSVNVEISDTDDDGDAMSVVRGVAALPTRLPASA